MRSKMTIRSKAGTALTIILLAMTIQGVSSIKGKDNPATVKKRKAEKIPITVFYESLCPSCLSFLIGSLRKTITTPGWQEMLDIQLIPYGNTEYRYYKGKGTLVCQHGLEECRGDKYHQCILELTSIFTKQEQLTMISCAALRIMAGMFMRDPKHGSWNWKDAVQHCSRLVAKENGSKIDFWKPIDECFMSPQKFEDYYRITTDRQSFPWAPWYLAWGVSRRNWQGVIGDNMFYFGCEYYKGLLPEACHAPPERTINRAHKDFHKNDAHGKSRKVLYKHKAHDNLHECVGGKCIRKNSHPAPTGFKMASKVQKTQRNKKNQNEESESNDSNQGENRLVNPKAKHHGHHHHHGHQ